MILLIVIFSPPAQFFTSSLSIKAFFQNLEDFSTRKIPNPVP